MEATKSKRRGYPSHPQKQRLIQLLDADEELRGGKFSATFSKKEAEERWKTMAIEINSIPGSKKTWTEWRKAWQDMKCKAKKKETAVRRGYSGTGGGPPPDKLSEDDVLIINTISKSELGGHSDIEESIVCFEGLPGSSKIPPSLPDKQDEDMINNNEEERVEVISDSLGIPETNDDHNKENIGKKNIIKKRTSVQRLDKSLSTVNALRETLADKNKYKKIFYENYIIEMRRQTDAFNRQTDALLLIANNLKGDE